MSHRATNWAIRQKGLKPATKIVLWHLADRHNPETGCFPMQKTLAEDCEMSRSTLNLHLDKLEELGLIRRETGIDQKTKRQRPTRYFFAFEDAETVSENETQEPEAVSENHAETVSDNRTQAAVAVSDFHQKPCPDFSVIRVLNPDTNSVREPVKEPRKVRVTRISQDAVISERMIEIAEEEGYTANEARAQFVRFKSGAIAKDRRYANWEAAWRNWFTSPYFKQITTGGRIDDTHHQTFNGTSGGRQNRPDPALEQIARLAGFGEA